jgi:hypothetical protein
MASDIKWLQSTWFLNRINVIQILTIENKRKSDLMHNKDGEFSIVYLEKHALWSKHMVAHKSNVNQGFSQVTIPMRM